jgi:hypothetical protein
MLVVVFRARTVPPVIVVVATPRPLFWAHSASAEESTDPPVIVTPAAAEEELLVTHARTANAVVLLVWTEPPVIVTLAFPVAVPLVVAASAVDANKLDVLLTWPPFIVICKFPPPDTLLAATTELAFELIEPPSIVMFASPLRGLLIVRAVRPTPVIEVRLVALMVRALVLTAPPCRNTAALPAFAWTTMPGLFRLSVKPSLPVY